MLLKSLVFACAAALTVSVASAQSVAPPPVTPPPAPIAIKAVKPGVFMVTGQGGNSTVRVGTDGVILVDTKNWGQKNYDDLLSQIKTVTDKPVKFVFITHVHGDHIGNSTRFIAAGVPVIGHENLPPLLTQMAPNTTIPGWTRPQAPTVLYKDKTDIKIAGAQAIGLHFFNAHTGGDTLVFFPDVKAISFGDELVIGQAPNPDYGNGGSVAGWIKTFDEVLKLDFDTAIPGHGPDPVTKADVKTFRDRLELFLKRANEQIKAGVPKDQLISKIKVDDFGWTMNPAAWTQPARLDGFYAEAAALK